MLRIVILLPFNLFLLAVTGFLTIIPPLLLSRLLVLELVLLVFILGLVYTFVIIIFLLLKGTVVTIDRVWNAKFALRLRF